MKLLIITPHLSTGGAPQVTLNKIKLLSDTYDIYCIEYSLLSYNFIVQRNGIINILGDKFYSLGDDKSEIHKIISEINPDIISFEEFPEFFMDDSITEKIYTDRTYKIYETTHDSSFNPANKRWFPDKFIFVSAFNAFKYSMYDIPYSVIEYPVDKKTPLQENAIQKLGLDPDYKHVVNVGLFTPRKNQKYLFEIARVLESFKIKFHFIGNQADNFKYYWEPLMNNKPDNCVIWYERNDVDTFIQASDLFFFGSKGDKFNKELNPIAIKEALEYDIPMMLYNLDVYCGKYDDEKSITFLTGDLEKDVVKLCEILNVNALSKLGTKSELFKVNYTYGENKLNVNYIGNDIKSFKVSVRELSSTVPIYWFEMNTNGPVDWFVVPIPTHILQFENLTNFKGFLLEVYDESILVESKEIIINNDATALPKLNFLPFDCSFTNFMEFFSTKIYDQFNLNNLDTVLDVGANIGLFAKYMIINNTNKIICVEANPFLKSNLDTMLESDKDKVTLYMNPLSANKEKVIFNYANNNSTIGSFKFDSNTPGYEPINSKMELETITLDEIIKESNVDRISLFKCDIEGGEYDLIESISPTHMGMIDRFLIEFHRNSGELTSLIYKLEQHGFESEIYIEDFYKGISKSDHNAENGFLITKPKIIENSTEVIIITTYPDTSTRKKLTKECIESFRKTGRKIILTSHYPVGEEIQSMVDYYIYDSNNILINHSYYNRFYHADNTHNVSININGLGGINQSLAALINLFNGAKLAKELGFDKLLMIVYDVILHDNDIVHIEEIFDKISTWNSYLTKIDTEIGVGIETTAMGFKTDYFLKIFKDIRDGETFTKLCENLGCHNFLEHYFMTILKDEDNLWIANGESILPHSGLGKSSNSEYISILPVSNEKDMFVFYFYTFNIDNRIIHLRVLENNIEILNQQNPIKNSREFIENIKFRGIPLTIIVDRIDGDSIYKSQTFELNSDNINTYYNNGVFEYNKKPKIKLVHLQTTRNDEREQKSYELLHKISDYDIKYVLHKNEPYLSLPPSHNCLRPECVSLNLFDKETTNQLGPALTPPHYGCYESFKNGILSEFDSDLDFLIVCEGDCIIEVTTEEFANKVFEASKLIKKHNIGYFSFGDVDTLDFGWKQSNIIEEIPEQNLMFVTNKIIGLQCIMFPKSHRQFLFDNLLNHKWDAADIYFNTIFVDNNQKMGIIKKRITTQADGYSLIDKQYKEFIKK